jgi:hypothetical protein
MRNSSGLVMLILVGAGFFGLLAVLGTPTPGPVSPPVNRMTYAPEQRVTSSPVKGLTLPPMKTPCTLGAWRWANHADTKTAFVHGTIETQGVKRVRIEARDGLGNWVGRKEVPVDGDGKFEMDFSRPNHTGEMKIHVTCDPNHTYDAVVDYGD